MFGPPSNVVMKWWEWVQHLFCTLPHELICCSQRCQ